MKKLFQIIFILFTLLSCAQEKGDLIEKGKIEMANQNFENAISLFTEAIAKKQNTAEAFFARGLCYNLNKDFKKSTEDFNSAESLGFNDIKLYTLRGFAFNQINKNELALKDLNKAIELNPEFYPKNFFNRAMLKVIFKKNDEALSDLNEYLKRQEDPIAYFERGKVYLNIQRKEDACKDFEMCLNLGFNNEDLRKLKNSICN